MTDKDSLSVRFVSILKETWEKIQVEKFEIEEKWSDLSSM